MVGKLKQVLHLYALYGKMDAQWFAQDTWICVLTVLSKTISNLAAVLSVFLLAVRFDGVGGFSADEILFMLGLYTLSTGLYNLLFMGNNTGDISRRVGRGQLDHCLMQPIPLWMQLLTEGFLPVSGSGIALCGVGVLVFAVARLGLAVTPLWVLGLAVFALCSLAVQVSMGYIVSYSAFTHPAGSEEISSVMHSFLQTVGYYPLTGLSPLLRGILITVLPAGCLAWLPSVLLLGKTAEASLYFFYPLFAVLLCGLGAMVFQKGMKYYAKVGSQRYKNMGHRR